ncbi:hypothetical protein IC220_03885 [Wolbachia endosymbiont of Pentalonia nigronervosa]|jgi:hypothetical protein|uniref:hypothetical protein n=1 Tax=Wolbachia endosymbiont of Pentalonia nigronervosa TaxID=1301914 RepID=UPI00165FCA85|nr:hypothetical protein [Wolbachia endosymbiont of Pentalonia nigronervosa]MBD0391591.1 hypothetical protein [Wolbachia endosymbiont of Pentalonia nigronervosa]
MGIASFFEERGREFLNLSKWIRFKRGAEELYFSSADNSVKNTIPEVPAGILEYTADYTTPEAHIVI